VRSLDRPEVVAWQGEPEYQVENVSILLTIFKQLRIKQKTGNLIPPRLRASSRCEGCELIEIDGDGGAHDIGGKLDFFPCKVLSGVDIVNYVTGISLRVWHSGRV